MALRVGIIGQSGPIDAELYQVAYKVGRLIALKGAILFSGGTDGVMEAASRGAQEAGGVTVGILPGDDLKVGNKHLTIPVTTGLAWDGRSMVLINSVDVVLMLGGANGTLGELTLAYMHHKPVVIIRSTGGWAARIENVAYEGKYLDYRKNIELRYADGPEEAVDLAFELAGLPPALRQHASN